MGRTYLICNRNGAATIGYLFLVVGILLLVASLLAPLGALGSGWSRGAPLMMAPFGLVAITMGWQQLRVFPFSAEIRTDETIVFSKPMGLSRIRVADITELEITQRRVGAEEDGDARQLVIRHERGSIRVPWFREMDRFIADLRRINPRLAIGSVGLNKRDG